MTRRPGMQIKTGPERAANAEVQRQQSDNCIVFVA